MDAEKVLKLAELARIKLSQEEAEGLSKEFGAILSYVGEVKEVASATREKVPTDFALRNVMRKDGEGHESALYTETLLSASPEREGNYFKVKKIL